MKLLQTYFLNKQATSPLHAAVVKADDRHTHTHTHTHTHAHHRIYFVQIKMNSSQTRNTITKLKDHGPKKSYTTDTLYDLSQQYVDIHVEASNKWLAYADLLAETEAF